MVPFKDSEFQPDGKLLKYWTLLPQVSTTVGGEEIPPLFGALRNIALHYIFFGFLLILELACIYNLFDQGTPTLILIILSLFDFIIAIIPALWETKPGFSSKQIKANIYIAESKLQLKIADDSSLGNKRTIVEASLNQSKKSQRKLLIAKLLFSALIIVFASVKFWFYWGILGSDIFVETIGRLLLATILLSVFVHIICTKTILYHLIFWTSLKKQIDNSRRGLHKTPELYHAVKMEYQVSYAPVSISNFKLLQEISTNDKQAKDTVVIKTTSREITFNLNKIDGFENVFLLNRGIFQEHIINELYTVQHDPGAKRAIIAKCKEKQLSQIIGE
jgi:hypothetical protein